MHLEHVTILTILTSACDWLNWLTCVPVGQLQAADNSGRCISTYVAQTLDIVGGLVNDKDSGCWKHGKIYKHWIGASITIDK